MKKRNIEITDWVKSNCDPTTIPSILLKEGLEDGTYGYANIVAEINLQAKPVAMSFIEKDKEIQNFLKLLKTAPFEKKGLVAQGGVCYLNLSRFILSDELREALFHEYESIKQSERRLAALAMIIEQFYPRIWHYNPGGRKNSMWVIGGLKMATAKFKRFLMLMDPEIEDIKEEPNRDSSGAYSYYYFYKGFAWSKFSVGSDYFSPMLKLEERFSGNDYIDFCYGDGPGTLESTFSLKVLVAYGFDQSEALYKNLASAYKLIAKSSAEGRKQRILDKFCHNRFAEVKDNPDLISAINRITEGKHYSRLFNCDFNVDYGIIVFINERSESGRSGGVAQISQVVVLYKGQEKMKEFMYRDRYSGSNDNHAYDFSRVKIIDVKENSETLEVTVEAKPRQNRYSATTISFSITPNEIKPAPFLSRTEQAVFISFFQKSKNDKLTALRERHAHRTSLCMSKDYSGYISYPDPRIREEIIKPEIGVGAFVTQECIDHRVAILQWRYVLYLVKNQSIVEIFEDHSYEDVDDSSISGLDFFGNKLNYTSREGRKEMLIR